MGSHHPALTSKVKLIMPLQFSLTALIFSLKILLFSCYSLLASLQLYLNILSYRFNVSLLCGPQPDRANVAFQLAVQFDTHWVTRNTRISKEWGEEEGTMPRKFPFSSQKQFVIELFTSNSAFFVSTVSCSFLPGCMFLISAIVIIRICHAM